MKKTSRNSKTEEIVRAYQSKHRRLRKWYSIVGAFAAVLVFTTVYLLILPALTMERETICGKEEHVHDSSCYAIVSEETLDRLSEDSRSEVEEYLLENGDKKVLDDLSAETRQEIGELLSEDDSEEALDSLSGDGDAETPDDSSENISEEELALLFQEEGAEAFESLPDGVFAVLICEEEEHTHTDVCYPVEDTTEKEEAIEEETTEEEIPEVSAVAEVEKSDASSDSSSQKTATEDATESPANSTAESTTESGTNTTTKSTRRKTVRAAESKLLLNDENITKLMIYYKCSDDTTGISEWQEVTDAVALHGDDSLKLYIAYENVSVAEVKAGDYKLYYALPDWMEAANAQTSTLLDSNSKAIGTIGASDGYLVISYDSTWLDSMTGDVINGDASVETKISTTNVKSNKVVIGSLSVNMDYTAGEWESKYGTVNVEKSDAKYIEQEDGYDLLQYTVTVSTEDDPMTDIKIKDYFSNLKESTYIEEVVGVTKEETTITNTIAGLEETSTKDSFTHGSISRVNGIMVWNIGDMEAFETRTLTYQVKLKKGETGRSHTSAVVFYNVATAYAGEYEHETATSQFNLIGKTDMRKNVISCETDEDGIGATITYYIKLTALSNNTYTMDNLKIFDFSGYSQNYITPIQDLTLLTDSFHLYEGDASSNRGVGLEEIPLDMKKDFSNETEDGKFKNFTLYIGDFAPGETKTLIYQMKVNDSYYLNSNEETFNVYNRATVYEDDTKNPVKPSPNQGTIQAFSSSTPITFGKWERKYTGERQETDTEITMDKNVYEKVDSTMTQMDTPATFIVPEGSYKYEVVVNENGALNVNSAIMQDLLGDKMKYTGYVRVDAYDTLKNENLNVTTLDTLNGTILRTAWIKVDGETSFSFTPSQLGFENSYAYNLTYYTKLVDVPDNTYLDVSNSFIMFGTIYGEDGTYTLINGKITVTVNTHAMSSSGFQAEKSGWYQERATGSTAAPWDKGTLYWYIRATGTEIPAGITLKDQVEGSNHKLVNSDSLIGVYLADETIPSSIEELEAASNTKEIGSDQYEVSWESSSVSVKFLNSVTIPDNQAIYVIVKTALVNKPGDNEKKEYSNSFYQKSSDDGDFAQVNTAEQTVIGGNVGTKTLQGAFIYDGTTYWQAGNTSAAYKRGTDGNLKTSNLSGQRLTEPGTYIEYLIDVGRGGLQTGEFTISDVLPEGVEIAFFRNAWFNNETADNVEIEGLDESKWEKYTEPPKKGGNVSSDLIYYYNSETREIRWKVENAKVKNTSNVMVTNTFLRFQLVLKVVDPEVLMGVKSASYANSIDIYQNNQKIETDSAAAVTISANPISKTRSKSYEGGSVLPFQIVVNEFGEDLIEGSDKLVLVDEMSSDLVLDMSSIEVVDKNGKSVTDMNIAVETEENKTLLKITIPDEMKLTIRYEAMVNALPNKSVSISNSAYWEGYASTGSVVTDTNFSYSVTGTAEVSGLPTLKLTKLDAQNIMKKLAGATYAMQEARLSEDGTYELVGEKYTATTDQNGELTFAADDHWMKFNTIYCLTEIEAPEGYVCDPTPKYIALATKNDTTEYPEEVLVRRNTLQFIYEATDEPEKTKFELPETGGTGTLPYRVLGGFLLAVAAVGFAAKKKQRLK